MKGIRIFVEATLILCPIALAIDVYKIFSFTFTYFDLILMLSSIVGFFGAWNVKKQIKSQ